MFENILPHQIILIWIGITGLTGTIVSLMISEGKNPLYILGNIFFCGFVGALFGGFFVSLTDALVWDFWSLLIPVFIGGIVSFLIAMFLRDRIPKPTIEIKPIAMVVAILMIMMLSVASSYPLMSQPTRVLNTSGTTPQVINIGDVRIIRPTGYNYETFELTNALNEISFGISNINQLTGSQYIPVYIRSYHTSIDFPNRLAENPSEGDYLGFKLTFGVAENSPVDWQKPVWFVLCWGDVNNNGELDENDTILSEQYFKIPSKAGGIHVSAPCVYDENGQPMWAMYGYTEDNGDYYLLPILFGTYFTWKDDSQYTFANTPEGFKPPYDQASWQVDATSGEILLKENIYSWIKIQKGQSYDVYGKLYCPTGMSQTANDWYLTIVAFDVAYSYQNPVAIHHMHFQVGSGDGGGGEEPIVNINSLWWVEVSLFALVGIACLAIVKYGSRWAFR